MLWTAGIVGGVAVVVAVAGLTGGLRTVPENVPQIRPGQTAHGHRYSVTLVSCTLSDKAPAAAGGFTFNPPGRYLAFKVNVVNLGPQTSDLGDLTEHMSIRLDPGGYTLDSVQASVVNYVNRDPNHESGGLEPGIPETATLVFKAPPTGPKPDSADIELKDEEYGLDFFFEQPQWNDTDEKFGQVTLPVKPARTQAKKQTRRKPAQGSAGTPATNASQRPRTRP